MEASGKGLGSIQEAETLAVGTIGSPHRLGKGIRVYRECGKKIGKENKSGPTPTPKKFDLLL